MYNREKQKHISRWNNTLPRLKILIGNMDVKVEHPLAMNGLLSWASNAQTYSSHFEWLTDILITFMGYIFSSCHGCLTVIIYEICGLCIML